MKASDLLLIDESGKTEGFDPSVDPMAKCPYELNAFYIHKTCHQRKGSSGAVVLHTHQPNVTTLTTLAGELGRLQMIHMNSTRFFNRIAYWDSWGGNVNNDEAGDTIAEKLRDKKVLLAKHHGVIVTGPAIAKAFDDLYYLDRAAELQLR